MVPRLIFLLLNASFLQLIGGNPTPEKEINNNINIDNTQFGNRIFARTVNNFEKSISYLDETVRNVETLINANSTLPRLTRGEILEIIENITKADLLSAQLKANSSSKSTVNDRLQKAVMLVMPYTPNERDFVNMQDLFTKPPVTKMIRESIDNKSTKRPLSKSSKKTQGGFYGEVFPEPLPDIKTTTKKPINNYNNFGNKVVTPMQAKLEVVTDLPIQKIFIESVKLKPVPTKTPPTKSTEVFTESTRLKPATAKNPRTTSTEISVIMQNSVQSQTYPFTRKRRPLNPPPRFSNHKYPDETNFTTPKSNQILNIINSPKLNTKSTSTIPTTTPSKSQRVSTAKPFLSHFNLPDHLKSTIEELDLQDSINNNPSLFAPVENYAKPPPLNNNVKTILSSIGVYPSTSTTTIMPGLASVADTLSPDMQELLMSFGLLPNPNDNVRYEETDDEPIGVPTAEIDPESFVKFKPLPERGHARSDVEELLQRFGLGGNVKDSRTPKGFHNNSAGNSTREAKKVSMESNKTFGNDNTKKKEHIFDPTVPYATKEELEKLNQLLDIIKQLDKLNRTGNEEYMNEIDVKKLQNIMGSLNKGQIVPLDEQEWAPDPLNYDYGLSKNEVKRQENESSSSTTENVVTVTPAATTTTVPAQNLKDLEDSFGGSSSVGTQATLPPATEAPKNGFYYLLDWNSFFEIDDQKGKRVNLRFQPHAGDPKRFYSVSVP